MREWGEMLHMTCFMWCVNMTWHVYGLGSAGNVRPTCNGHGQDQRVTAYARSQVYTADKARRDIGGAQWDIETGDWVVCSSAGRKELKITRKMRAAWAGLSVLRQELFRATCEDPDTFGMSISCYQACMKCRWSYLVRWGSAAVAGCCIMEGPKCKVILSWWRSNLEQIKLFLCGNQLLRHGMELGIKLS